MSRRISEEDRRLLLLELSRRESKITAVRGSLFPEQLAFIDDPCRTKTAQCTRRAGKSYCAGAALTLACLETPGCTCLYIATTREQAKRIMYKDVLKVIDKTFDLKAKFNHTTLEVVFPNGSVIYLLGVDSKPEEMEKALGQKYKRVIIDEAGSWKQDQVKLVHDILEPACADLDGEICLTSSPVGHTRSYFFQITSVEDPNHPKFVSGWSRHKWTWAENPHIAAKMRKHIEGLKQRTPRIEETPAFRNNYLNEWVVDPGNRVYRYDPDRNTANSLPQDHEYRYYLGLDLGFNDDTAIVIAACSDTDSHMYFVEVFKKKELDITAVAEQLTFFKNKYQPVKMLVDGASKQAVEELKRRHGFPLEVADKLGKADMIEIMNADFITGAIKILPKAMELAEEYEGLIWDDKEKLKKVEHHACPNHAADGGLYTWRHSFHYRSRPKEIPVDPNSDDGLEIWWDKEARKGLKKHEEDFVKRDWGKDYGYN